MQGVLTGFTVIAIVIAVGYVLARRSYLGADGRLVLTRLAFGIATPCLLFITLARADLSVLLSRRLVVTALSTAATAAVFISVGLVRSWGAGRITIGALCSSYVNAANLGIPIALYVLGDASLVAPVLLFQQIALTPLALTVLDLTRPDAPRQSLVRRLTTPLRNPMAVGSLSGVAVSATGLRVPQPFMDPLTLIGNMSVPAVLLAFGMSLRGAGLSLGGPDRAPAALSAALKTTVQPLIAWTLGTTVFALHGRDLLDVTVVAALPAAQNLFTFATQYAVAERLARDSILLSTLLSVPALAVIAALLG